MVVAAGSQTGNLAWVKDIQVKKQDTGLYVAVFPDMASPAVPGLEQVPIALFLGTAGAYASSGLRPLPHSGSLHCAAHPGRVGETFTSMVEASRGVCS